MPEREIVGASNAINMLGRRVGKLVVIARAGSDHSRPNCGLALWRCRCDCGIERDVSGAALRRDDGPHACTRSCGRYR
jgi:hypothetical protein